jgi:hypothetical protein
MKVKGCGREGMMEEKEEERDTDRAKKSKPVLYLRKFGGDVSIPPVHPSLNC